MNYNFTDQVRKVLAMAREETIRLHHDYVGTEHILLALIREEEGVAATVLANFAVDPEQVRTLVKESAPPGKVTIALGDLPYNAGARKVLKFAMEEARHFNHSYVGTEHLLLGLLRKRRAIALPGLLRHRKSIAADVLTRLGISFEDVWHETAKVLRTREQGESRFRRGREDAPNRTRELLADEERRQMVAGLLRPAATITLRLGGSPRELRAALERAIEDVFGDT